MYVGGPRAVHSGGAFLPGRREAAGEPAGTGLCVCGGRDKHCNVQSPNHTRMHTHARTHARACTLRSAWLAMMSQSAEKLDAALMCVMPSICMCAYRFVPQIQARMHMVHGPTYVRVCMLRCIVAHIRMHVCVCECTHVCACVHSCTYALQ